MTAPDESFAVMTDPAASDDTPSPGVEPRPSAQLPPEAPPSAEALPEAMLGTRALHEAVLAGAQSCEPRSVSPNAVIALLGTLLVASLGAMTGLMTWQMSSLGDSIDKLDSKIDTIHDKLDSKIDTIHDKLDSKIDTIHDKLDSKFDTNTGELRAEMQAGFRAVNAALLDHTDRLARLETAVGLLRPADDETPDDAADPAP